MLFDVGDPIPITRECILHAMRIYFTKQLDNKKQYAFDTKKPLEPKLAREAQLLLP